MKSAALCIEKPVEQARETGFINDNARRILLGRLKYLRHGELVLIDWQQTVCLRPPGY